MIHRLQKGLVPDKPHVVFEPEGKLSFEHCLTREGFDGSFTILYHKQPPHWIDANEDLGLHPGLGEALEQGALLRRHMRSQEVPGGDTPFMARKRLFHNPDIAIWMVHADKDDDTVIANADGDDLFFVQKGSGKLETPLGVLEFGPEDYVYVPRWLPHRVRVDEPLSMFIMEGLSYIDIPGNFRNHTGQLKMDAPYTHRDFRAPEWPAAGPGSLGVPRTVLTKKHNRVMRYEYTHDLFDIYGWDGQLWPFAFPIRAYQPKTGLVHLPPTIHTTFVGGGFVVCSFVPRVVDFHEKAIPCPYPHSSPDCDEILFYVDGNFTSRKGIDKGSISYHPMGLPHGPHPGTYEASIGTKRTSELAVMVDTFKALGMTSHASASEVEGYNQSWVR